MRVDGHNLVLVRAELARRAVQRDDDGVLRGLEADRGRSQLHGLHGVLHLVQAPLGAPHCHVAVILIAELEIPKNITIELVCSLTVELVCF